MDEQPINKRPWIMSVEFVLQLGAIIVSLTIGYVTIDMKTSQTQKAADDLLAETKSLQGRVREVETQQIRLDERFTNIMTLLSRIDQRLEKSEGK